MILVDTSVWIDHLRSGDQRLVGLLERGEVLSHPSVVGEVGLGSLRQRGAIIESLQALPMAVVAADDEVMLLIEQHRLFGRGIGWIDAHLLASVRLTPGARLWTNDKRLSALAQTLGVAASPSRH
ncbi:MAG: PIN domain-containing protein [Hydrogenophaga sp.]|uniref:type II toxin-antitoxin system VapC family toxin n=1 Tax=Hydrogenophaga sp. TaxID=1904254 RepID=UPI00169E1623|nr:type II toxin-antitoxin system VapC family toxin [Hydrogenophaga sp.]NIM40671.1 PIN domain-containing protein [Hydrogenophaga sp.]NIN26146.1 PIN domain-containing protein [Hydrogenophaga sp.]NIN31011.1 PIN domain-containing protein [Hydrogenophaga sp.]NIN55054.1 PIN domain-containing protein [Hydrogenophaga sp.]NIO51097.1 PIN domain-containing protein [Hydrogenophaga sp.]